MLDASQSVNLVFYYYHTRAVMIFFVGQSETMHPVYISRTMTLVGLSLTPFTGKLVCKFADILSVVTQYPVLGCKPC
jgi:hypothetical protein